MLKVVGMFAAEGARGNTRVQCRAVQGAICYAHCEIIENMMQGGGRKWVLLAKELHFGAPSVRFTYVEAPRKLKKVTLKQPYP